MKTMKTIAFMFLACTLTAYAADPCATAKTTLTAAEKKMYARSISSNLTKFVPPAQITVDRSMSIGNWTAVWATPKSAEQGVFFYSQEKSGLKYYDVWGGYAQPAEKSSLVQWVKKLDPSAPDAFAQCFAEKATAGH